ncbi:ABC transporter permease [Blastococcus sp. SYSU D00820]
MDELRLALPRSRWLLTGLGVVVALFLLAPLLVILPMSLSDSRFLTFPPREFSTRWFTEVWSDPGWQAAAGVSLRTALVATLLAVVAGTAAALALRRRARPGRLAQAALLSPMVIPQLVLALGLYVGVREVGGSAGLGTLVVGQAVLAVPLVYVTVAAGLRAVDPALSRAAESLGHPWWSTVLRVELPLVARSVIGAALLAFGLCFDESVLSYYLAPAGDPTLPSHLWSSASQSVSPEIAAVSALVMGFAVVLIGLLVLVLGTRRKGERS